MYQLTYISTARLPRGDDDVTRILAASRRNNGRDGITGLLLYDGKRFLQALEGPQLLVDAAIERIRADVRHRAPAILSKREVAAPEFGNWNMAWEPVRADGTTRSVHDKVKRLVASVSNANTRALFTSFALIDRSEAA